MTSPSPRYYAELHANINAISLAVQLPVTGLACTLTPNEIYLIPSSSNSSFPATAQSPLADNTPTNKQVVRLPCSITPTKTTLDPSSANSSILSLKLAVEPSHVSSATTANNKSSPAELPLPPLAAAELQGLEDLACGVCRSTLLLSGPNSEQESPAHLLQQLSLAPSPDSRKTTTVDSADASSQKDSGSTTKAPPIAPSNNCNHKRIKRIIDLPSEHWQELVECWMCHDDEDIKELREGDLGAREGQVLVGTTYLLIHAVDINQDAIQIHPDAKEIDWTKGIKRRWRPLVCSCCLHSVGDGWYHSVKEDGSDLELLQVKLHKYGVQYIGQDPKESRRPWSISRQRYVPYLLAELFESMRHHATYRFILEDRLSGEDLMLVWVLNWDATIMTNQKPRADNRLTWFGSMTADIEELQHMDGPRKVVKVLYLIKPPSSSKQDEKEQGVNGTATDNKEAEVWKRWRADHGVEHVQVLPTMALGVQVLLEQSSSLLPPDQNKVSMDNMRVGWLLL